MAPADIIDRIRDEKDRVHESEPYFLITNAPGPFRLVAGEVEMYERRDHQFASVELTVLPIEAGKALLGHNREFKIPFEVALKGATNTLGYGAHQPRNVRFLGKFVITSEVQSGYAPCVDSERAAPVLDEYRWEVVFNPESRKGMVFRLKQPLPWEWTL